MSLLKILTLFNELFENCLKSCFALGTKTLYSILTISLIFYIVNVIRSFNAENLGSVGQRAAKLLTIKL